MDSLAAIVEPLLEWYGRNARSLPWREEPAPYRVWVSEIMLQQTRVEAVSHILPASWRNSRTCLPSPARRNSS